MGQIGRLMGHPKHDMSCSLGLEETGSLCPLPRVTGLPASASLLSATAMAVGYSPPPKHTDLARASGADPASRVLRKSSKSYYSVSISLEFFVCLFCFLGVYLAQFRLL